MPLKGVYRAGVVGKNVGKKVANTKKMVKWGLLIDNKKYVVMVKHSIVSGKKTIFVNNEIIHEAQQYLTSNFDYTWKLENHILQTIINKDDEGYFYDLIIDDVHFFDLDDIAALKEQQEAAKAKKAAAKKPVKKTTKKAKDEEEEEGEEEEEPTTPSPKSPKSPKKTTKKAAPKKVVKKPQPVSAGSNFLGINFEDGEEDDEDFFAVGGTLEEQLAGLDFSVIDPTPEETETPKTPKTPIAEKKKRENAKKYNLGDLVNLDDDFVQTDKPVEEPKKVHIAKKTTPAVNISLDDIKKLNTQTGPKASSNAFDPFGF